MAERRPAGFNVDLRFYDSDEVLSIPRKIRVEAVGAWTLCGSYAANQLTDGYVSNEKLKQLGVRPAIRDALMATKPEPLFERAHDGAGVQLTRWSKWQRTAEEVKAYRASEAERKRNERLAKSAQKASKSCADSSNNRTETGEKNEQELRENSEHECVTTSGDDEMSGRTSPGRSTPVRADVRTPETKTKTETKRSTSLTLVEGGVGGDPHSLPVAAKAAPANARGKRLPENWRPSDAVIAAMREQFPDLDLRAVHTEFVDYWCAVPGAKGRKTDWDATWRNRCREIAARQRLPSRNGSAPARLQGADLKAAQFQAMKGQP